MFIITTEQRVMYSNHIGEMPMHRTNLLYDLYRISRGDSPVSTTTVVKNAAVFTHEDDAQSRLAGVVECLKVWREWVVNPAAIVSLLSEAVAVSRMSTRYTAQQICTGLFIREDAHGTYYLCEADSADRKKVVDAIVKKIDTHLRAFKAGKYTVQPLAPHIRFAGTGVTARPAMNKVRATKLGEKICKICNVYIPTMEYFEIDSGSMGRSLDVCPFCIARFGREASMVEERFQQQYPELYEQYSSDLITRVL